MRDPLYRENGFEVLPWFCGDDERAHLERFAERLIAARLGSSPMPRLLWVRVDEDELDHLDGGLLSRAREAASRCLGVSAHALEVRARLFVKPPRVGAAVPWHQDEAYGSPELDLPQANVWIPLADVDEASGCLRVVPGSHRGPLLQHRPTVHPLTLELDGPPPAGAISLPVAAGGATVHDRRTVHASWPNTSAARRTAVVLVCLGPARRREAPLQMPSLAALHTASQARSNLGRPGAVPA
jgi:hypothetical protein